MTMRNLLCALGALALAGCQAPYKKSDAAEKEPLRNAAKDQSFQAFLGRLRIAVGKHDRAMLAELMASDFGWRWDQPPPGETPFDFWDQRELWDDLAKLLRQPFVPNDMYLVAPPDVVTNPKYDGWRVGMRIVGGSWRFAYFVPREPGPLTFAPAP